MPNYGQEYVMGALSSKTVILVTHQVDFLPAFDSVLVSTASFSDILAHQRNEG